MKTIMLAIVLVITVSIAFSQTITESEQATILRMREDEKLARDVYTTLNEKWNQKVFANILESEAYHMSQIKILIEKYKLEDPVAKINDQPGVFVNPEIQKMYDDFIASGSVSVLAAYKAGAEIEEIDIKELGEAIAATEVKDIKGTYKYLLDASKNHLVAFVRNMERMGVNYEPVVLSKEQFDAIIRSSQAK